MAAVSKTTTPVLDTAHGAHDMMVEIRQLLLDAGLSEVTLTGGYDATASGDSSQQPTVFDEFSPWMLFEFTDSDQAAHPVYIWVRTKYGAHASTDSSNYRYWIYFKASTEIGPDSDPGGEVIGIDQAFTATSNYKFAAVGVSGISFARFQDGALTIIYGYETVKGEYYTGSQYLPLSIAFLHVERVRSQNPAFDKVGICGCVMAQMSYSVMNTSTIATGEVYTVGDQGVMQSSSEYFKRIAGTRGLYQQASAVVAPVYAEDHNGAAFPFSKMFTVDDGLLGTDMHKFLTLDFSGTEKQYLLVSSTPLRMSPGENSTCGWLFEWQ